MDKNSIKTKDKIVLGIYLILIIIFSPFILTGGLIYLRYKLHQLELRPKLCEQIRQEWFPKRKYIFFLYSNDAKWKDYFEKELIPKIQNKAVIWNWSTRHKDGWNNDLLEAKILSLYRPLRHFYPLAIVFLPSGEVKKFKFYKPYLGMIKTGKDDYKNMEKDFLALVSSLGSEKSYIF